MNPMLRLSRIIGVLVAALFHAGLWGFVGALLAVAFLPGRVWWPFRLAPLAFIVGFGVIGLLTLHRVARRRTQAVIDAARCAVRAKLPVAPVFAAASRGERGIASLMLHRVAGAVAYGFGVGEAIAQSTYGLPKSLRSLLALADRGGHLPATLDRVALHESRVEARQTRAGVEGAGLAAALFVLLGITLIFMIFIIIPMYQRILEDFGVELPGVTKFIFNFTLWLSGRLYPDQIVPGAFFVVLLFIAAVIAAASTFWLGWAGLLDGVRWYTPIIHGIDRDRGLGDVFHLMEQYIAGGATLSEALDRATHLRVNGVLRQRLADLATLHDAGVPLADAASRARMPALVVGMLAGAEAASGAGALRDTLRFLGRYYDTRASRAAEVLRALVWPIVTLALAFCVASVGIALIAPLASIIKAMT